MAPEGFHLRPEGTRRGNRRSSFRRKPVCRDARGRRPRPLGGCRVAASEPQRRRHSTCECGRGLATTPRRAPTCSATVVSPLAALQ